MSKCRKVYRLSINVSASVSPENGVQVPSVGGSGVHTTSEDQRLVVGVKTSSHPFFARPILRLKCDMSLGFSMTTKANLLAGKYTFSY